MMRPLFKWAARGLLCCASALVLIGTGTEAWAGSFTVSPVRIELSPQRPLGSLTITNDGTEPVTIDAKAMVWTQQSGEDRHEDTRELIVTPPVFTLEPRAYQVVRIGLRRPPDRERELAYRVFLTENAPPPTAATTGVAMTLRLSVPIFIRPVAAPVARLDWSASLVSPDELRLQAVNVGNLHVQVADLRLSSGGQLAGQMSTPAYVLPGQTRAWTVKLAKPLQPDVGPIQLEGFSDAGDVKVSVPLR